MAVVETGRSFVADIPSRISDKQIDVKQLKILELPAVRSVSFTPVETFIIEAYCETETGYQDLKRDIKKILK